MNPADKEALRQQMLLRALLGDARPGVVTGWLRPAAPAATVAPGRAPRVERGLAVYTANAGAVAESALAAAFPTVQQLLGEESFAALARHFWRQHPPQAGDIAAWGGELAAFIAGAEALAEEPYLPDVARLEWALHRVQTAADAPDGPPAGLALLATHDPAHLHLHLPAGSVVLASAWPVFSLWWAHRDTADSRFDAVRVALAEGRGEQGLITRCGWAPRALVLPAPEARYTAALLGGRPLSQALQEAGDLFDFQAWLIAALQQQRLVAVSARNPEEA